MAHCWHDAALCRELAGTLRDTGNDALARTHYAVNYSVSHAVAITATPLHHPEEGKRFGWPSIRWLCRTGRRVPAGTRAAFSEQRCRTFLALAHAEGLMLLPPFACKGSNQQMPRAHRCHMPAVCCLCRCTSGGYLCHFILFLCFLCLAGSGQSLAQFQPNHVCRMFAQRQASLHPQQGVRPSWQ